jgi:hypothetical protein
VAVRRAVPVVVQPLIRVGRGDFPQARSLQGPVACRSAAAVSAIGPDGSGIRERLGGHRGQGLEAPLVSTKRERAPHRQAPGHAAGPGVTG